MKKEVADQLLALGQTLEQPETEDRFVENVVFSKEERGKDGIPIFKSSAPGRKMIVVRTSVLPPKLGQSYRVRIIEDTNPGEAEKGKFIAEIATEPEKELELVTGAKEAAAAFAENDFKKSLELLVALRKKLA